MGASEVNPDSLLDAVFDTNCETERLSKWGVGLYLTYRLALAIVFEQEPLFPGCAALLSRRVVRW